MRFSIFCLFILALSIQSWAQLRVCNHSFEWDGKDNFNDAKRPPLCWNNCPCYYPSIGNVSTVTLKINGQALVAQDDSMWVYLNAESNGFDNESISGRFSCANLLANVRYSFNFYVDPPTSAVLIDSQLNRPPPLLRIRLGNSTCDTFNITIYEELEYNSFIGSWKKRKCTFIADQDYSHFTIEARHIFSDSLPSSILAYFASRY